MYIYIIHIHIHIHLPCITPVFTEPAKKKKKYCFRSQHPLGCALLRSATCHASRFSKGVPTALRTTPEPQAAMVQPQTSCTELGDAAKTPGFTWDMVGIWWEYGGDVMGISWIWMNIPMIYRIYVRIRVFPSGFVEYKENSEDMRGHHFNKMKK